MTRTAILLLAILLPGPLACRHGEARHPAPAARAGTTDPSEPGGGGEDADVPAEETGDDAPPTDEDFEDAEEAFEEAAGTGFRVSGEVIDRETEDPVASAKVEVRDVDDMSFVNEHRNLTESTDECGGFELRISRAGCFKMTLTHGEYETAGVLLPAKEGERAELHIPLEPRVRVAARIPTEADAPTAWVRVTDAWGRPVAGAEVRSTDPDVFFRVAVGVLKRPDDPPAPPPQKPLTDERGEFEIAGLETGRRCVVIVEHGTLVPRRSVPFRVRKGEKVRLDFVLADGTAVGGTVRDETGNPVPGASVRISCPRGGDRRGTSDPEGRFLVEGIAPDGFYEVRAWKEGFRGSATACIEPGAEADLVLPSECVVEGLVLDAETGQPVADARVAWVRLLAPASEDPWIGIIPLLSGADGSFRLDGMKPGTFRIEVEARGYAPASIEVVLEPGRRWTGLRIPLER